MAIYHSHTKIISRGKGQSVVASAAYRSAERLQDERLGIKFDYGGKRNVVHSEILTPKDAPAWATNRGELWNRVEAGERYKNAQLAREIQLALPEELSRDEQIKLLRAFVQENYIGRGLIADINIHNNPGNPHAHILLTMRTIDKDGFCKTKDRTLNQRGLIMEWRKSWEEHANLSLAMNGHDIRIDHRSYAERGIDLEPQGKLGIIAHKSHKSRGAALLRFAEHQRIARENGERIIADPQIALDFLSRQQSTFTEYDIFKLAHRQSVDVQQYREVCSAIKASPDLIQLGRKNGQDRYTTRQTLEMEKNMLRRGAEMSERIRHPVERRYLRQARALRTMTPDQDRAFEHVMKSGDLCCVIGYAGSGKSYTLGAVREAYEAKGYRVVGTALAGIAAEGLKRESGIHSRTIARLMWDIENGREKLGGKDVLIIDESGMVATRQMARLIEYAHQGRAKIVLVGSGQQLQPIEAGGPFRAFYQRIGYAEMTGIRRQNLEWQKECTKQLEGNQADKALDMYEGKGRILGHETTERAMEEMVKEWRISHGLGSSVAVAYRNADVDRLNHLIRAKAKEIGALRGKEREFQTEGGKRMFSAGDRILFLDNDLKIGVMNGTFGEVERIRRSMMQVRLDDGTQIAFSTKDYKKFTHGYAATAHRLQGATLDRVFVLADKFFDRHTALVTLSRHRENVSMHWSKENFKDFQELKATLTRERPKTLALDHDKGIQNGHREARFDLFGKLDSGQDRAAGSDPGGAGRQHARSDGRTHRGDSTPEQGGGSTITEERADRPGMGEPARGSLQKADRAVDRIDMEVHSGTVAGGGSDGGGSADRIRFLAKQLFTDSKAYEGYRAKLGEAAGRNPTGIRRAVDSTRDRDELTRFKKEINLVEYAQAQGYSLDKRESSRNSKIMRHSNGDKIVVATSRDGHGIYFSVHNDTDNGSIVDFVQTRRGMNIGEVRRELRSWIGMGPEPERSTAYAPKPERSTGDARQMATDFARTRNIDRHRYLESRGIKPEIIQDPRFKGMIREDQRGNAVFPHYGNGGLTGYELKNKGFTGFSAGGKKGAWVSNNILSASAKEIVITESAIDALSHAQLTKSGKETAYISIGGGIGKQQSRIISGLLERAHSSGAKITIGTDRDISGDRLAEKLRDLAPEKARDKIERAVPYRGKDFNEYLQMKQSKSLEIKKDRGINMGRGR